MNHSKVMWTTLLVCIPFFTSLETVQSSSSQCTLLNNHIKHLKNGPVSSIPHAFTLKTRNGQEFSYILDKHSISGLTTLEKRDVMIDDESTVIGDARGAVVHSDPHPWWWQCELSIPTTDIDTDFIFTPRFNVSKGVL